MRVALPACTSGTTSGCTPSWVRRSASRGPAPLRGVAPGSGEPGIVELATSGDVNGLRDLLDTSYGGGVGNASTLDSSMKAIVGAQLRIVGHRAAHAGQAATLKLDCNADVTSGLGLATGGAYTSKLRRGDTLRFLKCSSWKHARHSRRRTDMAGRVPAISVTATTIMFLAKNVSISDDGLLIAVGVDNYHPYSGEANAGPGFARLYKWDSTTSTWVKVEDFHGNSTVEAASKDVSLCGDGTVLAMGKSHRSYSAIGSETGYVRVYGIPEVTGSGDEEDNSSVSSGDNSSSGGNLSSGSKSTAALSLPPSPPPSSSPPPPNATAVPPPPSPPPPPKSLVLADYESSASKYSVLMALLVSIIVWFMGTSSEVES